MRPTIKSCAREIKDRWPFLSVIVERGYCNTDRKPKGFRYITKPGKGRWGTRLIVRDRRSKVLLDHNNAETYRRVSEVQCWIENFAVAHSGGLLRKRRK